LIYSVFWGARGVVFGGNKLPVATELTHARFRSNIVFPKLAYTTTRLP